MKKILLTVLCVAALISLFSVSAYADSYVLGVSGDTASLTQSYTLTYSTINGWNNHTFPKYSVFTLWDDVLYSTDTYAYGSLFDHINEYRVEGATVPTQYLYFSRPWESTPPVVS